MTRVAIVRRITAGRPQTASLLLVVVGLAGALGGGWLIGLWAFGLVLICESAGLIGWGLLRDDGTPDARALVPPSPWDAHDVTDILDFESRRP